MKPQGSKVSGSFGDGEIRVRVPREWNGAAQKIIRRFLTINFFQVVKTKQNKTKPRKCFPEKRNASNQSCI